MTESGSACPRKPPARISEAAGAYRLVALALRVAVRDTVNGIDAVIDLVGGEIQTRSSAILKPGGILVSAVSKPDQEVAARHGVRALFFLVNVTTAHLTQIAAMIDAGNLAVNVGTVLPLADARRGA